MTSKERGDMPYHPVPGYTYGPFMAPILGISIRDKMALEVLCKLTEECKWDALEKALPRAAELSYKMVDALLREGAK